jgi:hypothetical protein
MKASQAIELMQMIIDIYGDCDFWIFNDTYGDHKVQSIKFGKNKLGKDVVFLDFDDKEDGKDKEFTLKDLYEVKAS